MSMKLNDTAIVEGLRTDNERVLLYVVNTLAAPVFGLVHKMGGDATIAQDVFQITLLAVRRKIQADEYEDQGKLRSYFLSTARYTMLNHFKAVKKRNIVSLWGKEEEVEQELNTELEAQIVKDKQLSLLYRGLNMLDAKCRELIELRYFDNMTMVQYAEEEEVSAESIRVKLMRCKTKLKKLVKQLG